MPKKKVIEDHISRTADRWSLIAPSATTVAETTNAVASDTVTVKVTSEAVDHYETDKALHESIKAVQERIKDQRKKASAKATPFSVTEWRKKFASAKTARQRESLKRKLAILALGGAYEGSQ